MRVMKLFCLAGLLSVATLGLSAQTLSPVVSQVTSTSFTLTWTTSQRLNTQVHFSTGGASPTLQANWTLTTSHSATVGGLQPGTAYSVEAESSYYSNPDLVSAPMTITTAASAGSGGTSGGSSSSGSSSGTSSGSTSGGGTATGMTTPQISNVTSSSFTIAWTTAQALNSQLHFGPGNTAQTLDNWTLVTQHSLAVTGLQPGTQYDVQAESSYYTNPDLLGPVETVTTLTSSGSGGSSTGGTGGSTGGTSTGGTSTGGTSTGGSTGGSTSTASSGSRLFPNASANWLYSAPTGTPLNISSTTSGIGFQVNDHTQGFDYPVQYTDGSHGCTTFTDTLIYNFSDRICVPNPASGYFPSVGGWGANDGHLVVLDTATGEYYDFWKLTTSSGRPTSTNVGGIVQGNVSGNGNPGTTAANITGLAGDILPGELDCATCLNHALSVIVPGGMNSSQVSHQGPATKTDGGGSGIFREGAKIRFDPSVNVSTLGVSVAVQAIMRALQLYGGVITDQTGGSQIAFYSSLPSNPSLSGINQIGQHLWIYY